MTSEFYNNKKVAHKMQLSYFSGIQLRKLSEIAKSATVVEGVKK